MLTFIKALLLRLLFPTAHATVLGFVFCPRANVEALTEHMWARTKPFKYLGGRDYVAEVGLIRVCVDIFGPEVKVGFNSHLLDCCPDAYGLTREEAKRLYDAILSNVPGTTDHVAKLQRQIDEMIRRTE